MKKRKNVWFGLLAAALFAYTVKNIFVGADVDEGYGVMVGWRLAMGDRLLLEMWEPHQTSAVFTALLIKPFVLLTGGTAFLNLYLRAVYFLVQGLIAWYGYRTLGSCLPRLKGRFSALAAMAFYVITPKCICIPEYSNLHMWFFALLCFQMMRYYCPDSPRRGRLGCLVWAGVFLSCDVLAYPSMALLFPVCLIFILRKPLRGRLCECAALALPCVLGAAAFVGYLLGYMSPKLIRQTLPHILGEGSHQAGLLGKLAGWGIGLGQMAAVLLGGAAVSFALWLILRKCSRRAAEWEGGPFYLFLFYLVQTAYQVYCWFTSEYNAGYPQAVLPALCLIGIYCYFKGRRRDKTGLYLILFAFFNYFAVLLLSNWGPMNLNPYLLMGAIGGFLCWQEYCQRGEEWGEAGEVSGKTGFRGGRGTAGWSFAAAACAVFVLCNAFGYCYLMIGGDQGNSPIYEVRGYNRQGMRKGILTAYMNAYRYNSNQEIWAEAVPDGSRVLYVGPSQFFCMLGDCVVSSPNTISTPVYDESLLAYWELNPDRYPDVVAVESWFGDIRILEEGDFMSRWLETQFQASRVVEYPYVTVYYR